MSFNNLKSSSNPFYSKKVYAKAETLKRKPGGGPFMEGDLTMTISGAVNKTVILTMMMMATFLVGYIYPSVFFIVGGSITAFIIYIITSFKPYLASTTAPMYALIQGLFVGSISAVYSATYEGIIFQAFSLTMACLLTMLMIYKSGLIKVTQKFRMVVGMAVGAIMIVYIISLIGYFVGFEVPFIHDSGPIGIGLSFVIIGVACLNLLLDFDNFSKGEENEIPKYMEWYFAMGLLFTIIWLYVELLRLLSKLRD